MKHVITGLLYLVASFSVVADDYPRLLPESHIIPIRSEYESYQALDVIEVSLILSGLRQEETEVYLEKADALIQDFKAFIHEKGNPESFYEKGELILDYLHETMFEQYQEFQTRTDVLLDTGVYNCVSSAVFYAAFGISIGLEVDTVNTDDHVFCSVRTEKGSIDVETTSPYGFNPGTKREFIDSFGKTGFTYVPPGNYAKREPGDMLPLLSFILQNRIASLQKEKKYFESVGLSVDRYAMLGNEKAFNLMLTEFINYAAYLNKQGRYAAAVDFLQYARERYRVGNAFEGINKTLTNNLSILWTDEGQFEKAEGEIEKWEEESFIPDDYAAELKDLVYDRKAYTIVNNEEPDSAEKALDRLFKENDLSKERYIEYIVFLYGKRAEAAGKEGAWLEAAGYMEQAIRKVGYQPQLERALKGYRGNYAIFVHNTFAELFNAKQFDEAGRVVEEGLKIVPESETLRRDLEILRKATASE